MRGECGDPRWKVGGGIELNGDSVRVLLHLVDDGGGDSARYVKDVVLEDSI